LSDGLQWFAVVGDGWLWFAVAVSGSNNGNPSQTTASHRKLPPTFHI
jgi:hypothetical protein